MNNTDRLSPSECSEATRNSLSLACHTPQSEGQRACIQRVVPATGFGRVQSDSRFEFIAWQCFTGGARTMQSASRCLRLPVMFL